MSHGEYDQAADLYRKELTASVPEGDRAHAALVRALLRAGKIEEAETEAKAWASAAPNSAWSGAAMADVQWRKGELAEAGKVLQNASHLDPCNAQVRYEIARYFQINDLMAGAANEINLAHSMDPVDPTIERLWLLQQSRSARLAQLTDHLEHATSLTDKDRQSLEKEKAVLSQPPSARCHVVSSQQSSAIPMRALRDGPNADVAWGLNVFFEGNSRRLEIDTGAHGLLITHATATALHLAPDEHLSAGGIGDNGRVGSTISKVHSIKVGDIEFQDCDVEVLDNDKLEVMGDDNQLHYVNRLGSLDGLIGGDVFQDFLLTLDFPGHTMKLDPLPAVPGAAAQGPALTTIPGAANDAPPMNRFVDDSMKTWTKVYSVGSDLIVPVHLNGGTTKLFLVDTGAGLDSISPDAAREVGHLSSSSNVNVFGISGKVKNTYTTGSIQLDFAGLRKQLGGGMTAFDTTNFSRSTGIEISGFLGAPTLQQLTLKIDYRDKLVDFSFDPKRITKCVPGIELPGCF